jgi:copper chaperone CopZ
MRSKTALKIHRKMKIKFLVAAILFISVSMKAQITTQILKVNGECSMCQKTIETACYGVKGLKKAEWNVDSLALTVTFDSTKTSATAILKRVAMVGYDNEQFKAADKAYFKLHGCCQYDRSRVIAVAAKKN